MLGQVWQPVMEVFENHRKRAQHGLHARRPRRARTDERSMGHTWSCDWKLVEVRGFLYRSPYDGRPLAYVDWHLVNRCRGMRVWSVLSERLWVGVERRCH